MIYKIKFVVTRKLDGENHFRYYWCCRFGGKMEIFIEIRGVSNMKGIILVRGLGSRLYADAK